MTALSGDYSTRLSAPSQAAVGGDDRLLELPRFRALLWLTPAELERVDVLRVAPGSQVRCVFGMALGRLIRGGSDVARALLGPDQGIPGALRAAALAQADDLIGWLDRQDPTAIGWRLELGRALDAAAVRVADAARTEGAGRRPVGGADSAPSGNHVGGGAP